MSKDKEKKEKKDKKEKKKEKKDKEEKAEKKKKKGKDKEKKKNKKDKKVKLSKRSSKSIASKRYAETMKGKEIMVSVVVITYNQERYIAQALDSILCQEVDFPVEILVGEDCSTDKTSEIVRKYQKKYPNLFQVFCREENLGPTKNAYELYIRTKGKYVASLEGDDYFCDPCKLQKQVNFLEKHSEFYACATGFDYIDQDGNLLSELEIPSWERKYWRGKNKNVYTWSDFDECRAPGQGSTIVTRNFYKTDDVSIIYKAHPFLGDITGLMIQMSHGDVYIMSDKTIAYRRNLHMQGHSWNMKILSTPFIQYHMLQYNQTLRCYANKYLPVKFHRERDVLNCFFRMVDNCFHYPTMARWRCVWKMLLMTDRKIHYAWVIVKAIYLSIVYPVVRNTVPLSLNDPMYERLNKTWKDFRKINSGKKLVLYGAGGGASDFLESYYGRFEIECIIDGDVNRQGNYFYGFLVEPSEKLREMEPDNTTIIITSGYYYRDIINFLEQLGFHHYFVYPLMEQKKWKYKPIKWLTDYISIIRD